MKTCGCQLVNSSEIVSPTFSRHQAITHIFILEKLHPDFSYYVSVVPTVSCYSRTPSLPPTATFPNPTHLGYVPFSFPLHAPGTE